MNNLQLNNEVTEKIKQEILTAWQEGHGGDATQVLMFQGVEGLIMLIPKALYQAELDLHRSATGGGRVLNQYLRTLLITVASEYIPLVEELTERKIDEIVPLIDLREGYVIAFYKYEK